LESAELPDSDVVEKPDMSFRSYERVMSALLTVATSRHRGEALDTMIDKAMNRSLPKDGETIEDEHTAKLAAVLAEHFTTRVSGGGTVGDAVPGAEIAAAVAALLSERDGTGNGGSRS
jgi:hypothetical protein